MVDFARLIGKPPSPPPIVPRLLVGVTGHRPHKLPDPQMGYDWANPLRRRLRDEMAATLSRLVAKPSQPRDRFAAMHVDSYLRQVEWKPGFVCNANTLLAFSGVALGVDQDFCGVCARLTPPVPYVAVVPFPGQESRWPEQSRRVYEAVLRHAVGIVVVTKQPPGDDVAAKAALKLRNEWICCVVDELISVYDGSPGGTASCTRYYERLGKRAVRIDPREFR